MRITSITSDIYLVSSHLGAWKEWQSPALKFVTPFVRRTHGSGPNLSGKVVRRAQHGPPDLSRVTQQTAGAEVSGSLGDQTADGLVSARELAGAETPRGLPAPDACEGSMEIAHAGISDGGGESCGSQVSARGRAVDRSGRRHRERRVLPGERALDHDCTCVQYQSMCPDRPSHHLPRTTPVSTRGRRTRPVHCATLLLGSAAGAGAVEM